MSLINGVWHDAKLDPPQQHESWIWIRCLIVKQLSSGEKKIDFANYHYGVGWVTSNGKGEVLYWAPLPKIPE